MDERLQVTSGLEMVLLAEENGDPAGFAALRIVPYLGQDLPYAEVTQLYVVPAHRRRGAGLALMRRAEEIARDRGCTSVHVMTGRDNLEAQAVYRAADYEALYVTFEKFL